MAQLIMTADVNKLDGNIKAQTMSFLMKLAQDDTLPGLHIEPISNSKDSRVRTGRVTQFYRAVLFKLQGAGDTAYYLFAGVWPHDDAIAEAKKAYLEINPVNGLPEVLRASEDVADSPATTEPQSTPVTGPDTSILQTWGIAREDLIGVLGLQVPVVDAAFAAADEDELYAVAEKASTWQGVVLLELAAGKSVDDIREILALDREPVKVPIPVSEGEENDEEVLAAFRRPAAAMQYAFIEDDEELRRAIDDGDFVAWRTFLHPEQRKYATADYNGPFRLSGGAGTGKTVVLIHRARELARKNPQARIFLTTYTTTLAESLRSGLKQLDPTVKLAAEMGDPGVFITGVDSAVSRVLKKAEPLDRAIGIEAVLGSRSGEIVGRTNSQKAWQEAIAAAGNDLGEGLASPVFMQAEYAMVVLPGRITSRDDYYRARRPGRGVALDRSRRAAVWSTIESYRAWTAIDGSIDYSEAASIAAAALEQSGPLVDHVLVDEGQDLTPSHWQFLRAVAAEGPNDLFIAEDAHQRIYGQQVVLGRMGIKIVGRSRRLTLNYRTTAQNLGYALGILSGETYVDAEGEVESVGQYRSARRGPLPQTVATASVGDELDKAAEMVAQWLEAGQAPDSIGVLVRDKQQMSRVVHGLAERGVAARQVDTKTAGTGMPLVMTMHRAKGMEFACVIIFGASHDELPASFLVKGLDEADKNDFLQRERSLLYVSATRARDELVVMWAGEPSEMLPVQEERS
ncbi:AAA family ATPase [Aeromicrobium sp. S22]|uniref:3'-5' exonuclease n=1 Tax=Aeromicrobium sp. S22 TaxID=2662029 RepID=UPI00129E14DE|nr:3'-5' exonuclease [Aeromicrobium sp. S22]MRK01383.1 AAA family ATPase [Aeromicrobium sp. S22]